MGKLLDFLSARMLVKDLWVQGVGETWVTSFKSIALATELIIKGKVGSKGDCTNPSNEG